MLYASVHICCEYGYAVYYSTVSNNAEAFFPPHLSCPEMISHVSLIPPLTMVLFSHSIKDHEFAA